MADYDLKQVALLVFGAVVAWEGFYMLFKVVALDGASWWLSGLPGIVVGTIMLIVGGLIAYGTYLEIGGDAAAQDVEDPDWSVPGERDAGGERVTDPSAGGHPEPVRDAAEETGDRRTVTDTTSGDEAASWSSGGGGRDGESGRVSPDAGERSGDAVEESGDPGPGAPDVSDGDGIRRTRVDDGGVEETRGGRREPVRESEGDRDGGGRDEGERGDEADG
jgi:hypothetical protein